ncbi:uncharacterized protein [Oryza sativa Japonica Group]|jgi:hypothetical protein|uniref:Uncharacterized protein n=2 Tax=Oryza sativa subsp. japonica TaxID=39947 RepID=A0A8J8Y5P0_ORYSJ|nr:uncharacterized protein LOC107280699 [Oryza sativa Japonica Group]EAZ31541.1 hypothetical protein OsJ_15681 [Oryza sativa Japonica Group]KAF2935202.1 hypothetical protein DAI22_04g215600 [Oryza sativa Japonica Group]CAE05139.1 OSJNBa0065H10.11 [Oryza sativa Japonica Group]
MADSAPAPEARVSGGDVPARLQQALALLFPTNLAAKAVLFAVVVALLPLLPTSQAPRIWELPHILLLGLIISYGVFGQRNADSEVAAVAATKTVDDESVESYVTQMMHGPLVFEENDGGGEADAAGKEGVQAWSSQYFPDDPLVVVADAGAGSNTGKGDEREKPLLLPVRKLKPATEESATLTESFSDGAIEEEEEEEEEETEFLLRKARYGGVREHAIPSPSSVLDADLTLSPCSPPLLPPPPPPPPPPPFLDHDRPALRKAKARSFNDYGRVGLQTAAGCGGGGHNFRSKSAIQASRSTFPTSPFDDHDLEEKVAASDISSFSSDDVVTDDGEDGDNHKEIYNYEEEEGDVDRLDDDDGSCDEELFELATRLAPEEEEVVEDEVDRKADEFIAKFREQIRMQRVVEPGRR